MADHSEAIEILEEALASGVRTVTVEGTTHTFDDADQLRSRLNYFRRHDDATIAAGKTRRTFNRINLF